MNQFNRVTRGLRGCVHELPVPFVELFELSHTKFRLISRPARLGCRSWYLCLPEIALRILLGKEAAHVYPKAVPPLTSHMEEPPLQER